LQQSFNCVLKAIFYQILSGHTS